MSAEGRLGPRARKTQRLVSVCCTGNICRSPMAEGVFMRKVADANLSDRIRSDSAGTHDYYIGGARDYRAQVAARVQSYDLSALRARRVERGDFKRFDLVLAMPEDATEGLLDAIRSGRLA